MPTDFTVDNVRNHPAKGEGTEFVTIMDRIQELSGLGDSKHLRFTSQGVLLVSHNIWRLDENGQMADYDAGSASLMLRKEEARRLAKALLEYADSE